jgi:hypothetical protein
MSVVSRPGRIVTIDFEGSSLHGVPIEVGVALWEPSTAVIHVWSALIRPPEEWQDAYDLWDLGAQHLHGLGQDVLLAEGKAVGSVARCLDELIGTSTAYCDGGEIDVCFRDRLYRAAGTEPRWRLGSMSEMVRASVDDILTARAILRRVFSPDADIPHRAGPDAARLLKELASETFPEVTVVKIGD